MNTTLSGCQNKAGSPSTTDLKISTFPAWKEAKLRRNDPIARSALRLAAALRRFPPRQLFTHIRRTIVSTSLYYSSAGDSCRERDEPQAGGGKHRAQDEHLLTVWGSGGVRKLERVWLYVKQTLNLRKQLLKTKETCWFLLDCLRVFRITKVSLVILDLSI